MKTPWLKWAFLFSVAINAAAVCTAVYVHLFVGPRPFVRHFVEKKMLLTDKRLHLTAEQEKTFADRQTRFIARAEAKMPVMRGKRDALIAALAAPKVDRAALDRAVADVRALQEEFHQDWVNHIMELKSVLSPEQQVVFGTVLREKFTRFLDAPFGPPPRPERGPK